jgi:Tol biopolymer transport system component
MVLRQIPQLLLPVYLLAVTTVIVLAQVGRAIGGDLLAFGSHSGDWERYVVDMNPGLQVSIASSDADDKQPARAASGRRLALMSDRDGSAQDIYVLDTQSGEVTNLTRDEARNCCPAWTK